MGIIKYLSPIHIYLLRNVRTFSQGKEYACPGVLGRASPGVLGRVQRQTTVPLFLTAVSEIVIYARINFALVHAFIK